MCAVILDRADRLHRIPPKFTGLDRLAARLDQHKIKIIDLTTIERLPDQNIKLPDFSWERLNGISFEDECAGFYREIAEYYDSELGITLNPDKEILAVPGLAATLSLLTLTFVDPGDVVLLPDPGTPLYRNAVGLAGGGIQTYYLYDRNQYLPDCGTIANTLAGRTKLWFLGYPHNPTTALADRDLFNEVTRLARRKQILIVFDGSYTWLGDRKPRDAGLFATTRAKANCVEIIPLDTNLGLAQLDLTIVAGRKDAIAGIRHLAESMGAIPTAGMIKFARWALANREELTRKRREKFAAAQDVLVNVFEELSWSYRTTPGLPFCWLSLPRRYSSLGFARRLLRRTGLKILPGFVFGEQGEGYARIALRSDAKIMTEVGDRLREFGKLWLSRPHRKRKKK